MVTTLPARKSLKSPSGVLTARLFLVTLPY
jgi:hypothetical protein